MIGVSRRLIFGAGTFVLWQAGVFAQTAPLMGDAFIAPGRAINTGSLPAVQVGTINNLEGLWLFDLTKLPAGTTASSVSTASLRIFVDKVGAPGSVNVNVPTASWSESTVTGTSGVGVGAYVAGPIAISTAMAGSFVSIPIAGQVQAWLTGAPNNGLIITAPSPASTSIFFDSKENTATSHPAVIEIDLVSTTGAAGVQGPQGPSGANGPQGPSGPSGPSGVTGLPGPFGPAGAAGGQGPVGPTGPTGPTGPQGPTGPAGVAGVVGLPGNSGPTGPTGPSGPVGPSGPTGVPGLPGAAGPTGPAGSAGGAGATGPAGPSGPTGASGPTGTAGPAGPSGPTGPPGAQGNPGSAGPTGASGPSGPAGLVLNNWSVLDLTTLGQVPGANFVIPDNRTEEFMLVNNTSPGVGVPVTLPHASTAGKTIWVYGKDYTANGFDLHIFAGSGDGIVSTGSVISGTNFVDSFYYLKLVADGGHNWYILDSR